MSLPNEFSLKHKVLKAGVWSLAGYFLTLVIRLGSNLFMTRQLLPDTFGLMAIASLVLIGLTMFSDLGLKPSIVQSKNGEVPEFLNTAWTIQVLRGIFLWLVALVVSVLISLVARAGLMPKESVYESSSLPPVIAILSFTAVIAGFESTKLLQASRNLSLAIITKIDITSQIVGFATMAAWVQIDHSIWALVAGSWTAGGVRTLLSHAWLPGLANRWEWDREALGEIVRFGKWIFLSSILFFLASNGDRILLGGVVDARTLGTYSIAFLIFSSIDQVLTRIIGDVFFPALSEIAREQRYRLKTIYYRFHLILSSLTYFSAGILISFGSVIIEVLYDSRYFQAGWILEILAVALLTLPFRAATQCFLALGEARVYFHLSALRTVALFLAVPVGFHQWGLIGAVWGIVFSYFSSLPLTILYSIKYGLFDWRKEVVSLPAIFLGLAFGEMLRYVTLIGWS